jgi:uncharacterized protein YqeY
MQKTELNKMLRQAMLQKDVAKRDSLRVLLGEIQSQESRTGKQLSEDEINKIIQKLVANIEEIIQIGMSQGMNAEALAKAQGERSFLSSMLPSFMSKEEIITYLRNNNQDLVDEINNSDSVGKLIGKTIGILKKCDISAEGATVRDAVMEISSNLPRGKPRGF